MKTKTIKRVVVVLLVLAGVAVAGHFAIRAYVSHRERHLIQQARGRLAKADVRRAALYVQRALRSNPRNVEACRLMAELNERAGSPAALVWRTRVVELKPRSLDDRLALAQTAIVFRDYGSATNALEGVDAAGKKTAAYHNVAGAAAIALRQFPQAEAHFLEAARLEPTNSVPQLNLAVVRLHGTNDQAQADARAVLKRLSANLTNSTLRCQAFRELVSDALRVKHTDAALDLSKALLQETNSAFTDRLLRLTVLRAAGSAEFQTALAAAQREATQGTSAPDKISELATWQVAIAGPKDALVWLNSLPRTTRTNLTVAVLVAGCQISLQDWRGLRADLEGQNWGEREFLRHAFQARGLRGQDLAGAAKGEWELALKAANRQKANLVQLLQLADQWKWSSETEDLLWSIVNAYPDERGAFQALSMLLFEGGRTRPLMMLCNQESKRSPSDLSLKNNLAMIALLLQANEMKPHDLAREVYQKVPTNVSFASTYAFSLHLQKKDAEALKIMQQLKPKDLERPTVAGYYGLILQATGDSAKAKVYLQWASKARLLPEEEKLFEQAKRGA